ncbi:ParM/StbA family protein [Gemmiger sp.]
MKKMSQSFFFVVASKIGDFANRFLNTVLQCCPTIFGRFAHPEAHFFCHFLEFGRGVGNLFEKKQNKSCYFQNVFNFLAADFSLDAGIFYFFRQFSFCFQVFHFIPIIRRIFTMSIIIGIDHGYYAIKTAHCSFPAGLTSYGEHEPYTRQGLLEFGGCFFVCGSGRQPIQRDKTANDNYYLLTLAAIAKEIRQRGLPPECSVRIAAGLPLTSFGRDKPKFKDYLLRSNQPVNYKFEGVEYSITIEEVAVFPQGYAALMTETGLLQDEPSMLLMDLGGWTVDLMRIDNAIPAADTAHSLELGMIRCVDDIREQVRRETGLSLTDAQIENMLAGQPCTVSDTVRDIVNKQGRKYTEHLLSATMEAGFDSHAIPAVLLGGGASVVSRHLSPKDGLCKTIFLLDDKVNAVGFERALAAVSRRKSEV